MQEIALSKLWYWLVLMAVVCYLIGSINFAFLVSKLKKQDIRKQGSGNPGTMNMFRTFGWKIGLLTFLLDAFKGGIPAVIFSPASCTLKGARALPLRWGFSGFAWAVRKRTFLQ